ncbi:MAG: hypothetical protein PVSMB7_23130 [Chloroflexota bacterium]
MESEAGRLIDNVTVIRLDAFVRRPERPKDSLCHAIQIIMRLHEDYYIQLGQHRFLQPSSAAIVRDGFFLAQKSYNIVMSHDEYHEALLERVHALQEEVAGLTQREALGFAYLISQEIPEEGARMLVAEMLMDYWARARPRVNTLSE